MVQLPGLVYGCQLRIDMPSHKFAIIDNQMHSGSKGGVVSPCDTISVLLAYRVAGWDTLKGARYADEHYL